MKDFLIEYYRHSVLNLGQALQGIRYIHSHPDIDKVANRGSFKHFKHSLLKRLKLVVNGFYFALIPPHWHHTKEEIRSFHGVSAARWFMYGYCAWRFNEKGEFKKLNGTEDPRWDPRCE